MAVLEDIEAHPMKQEELGFLASVATLPRKVAAVGSKRENPCSFRNSR